MSKNILITKPMFNFLEKEGVEFDTVTPKNASIIIAEDMTNGWIGKPREKNSRAFKSERLSKKLWAIKIPGMKQPGHRSQLIEMLVFFYKQKHLLVKGVTLNQIKIKVADTATT